MKSLAIHSAQAILPNQIVDATVIVRDGVISDILKGLVNTDHIPLIDVQDKILMAGVIDPHVHINEPGRTDWEGFDTATKAALAGGITSLIDMPLNASPVTTTLKAFEQKIEATKNQLHTNCGFWGGIIPGNEKEIEPLIKKGVLGFKAFLTHSGIDEFPNVREKDLQKAMPIIAQYNLPLLVHCELSTSTQNSKFKIQNKNYQHYLVSRPKIWEDNAIAMMIKLCEKYNCRTHIVHLSSANSIDQIAKAKQKGLPLTVETAQHYLYFNAEDIPDGQTSYKCAPPIREKENNEKLWQALKDGIIDFVATDHSPAPADMKELQTGNFMKAWGGISSIQFALPVLWTAAKKHDCNLNEIAKWLCENPAQLINQQSSKGKIEKGYDADLIVWDPNKTFTVKENNIHHKHKITPYLNEELYGVVEQTYLAGEKVYGHQQFLHLNKGKLIFNT